MYYYCKIQLFFNKQILLPNKSMIFFYNVTTCLTSFSSLNNVLSLLTRWTEAPSFFKIGATSVMLKKNSNWFNLFVLF